MCSTCCDFGTNMLWADAVPCCAVLCCCRYETALAQLQEEQRQIDRRVARGGFRSKDRDFALQVGSFEGCNCGIRSGGEMDGVRGAAKERVVMGFCHCEVSAGSWWASLLTYYELSLGLLYAVCHPAVTLYLHW
jgi:hypothetical protein